MLTWGEGLTCCREIVDDEQDGNVLRLKVRGKDAAQSIDASRILKPIFCQTEDKDITMYQ